MSWEQDTADWHQGMRDAAAARGVKPISSHPGPGMGSFAEDDPEQHQALANPADADVGGEA